MPSTTHFAAAGATPGFDQAALQRARRCSRPRTAGGQGADEYDRPDARDVQPGALSHPEVYAEAHVTTVEPPDRAPAARRRPHGALDRAGEHGRGQGQVDRRVRRRDAGGRPGLAGRRGAVPEVGRVARRRGRRRHAGSGSNGGRSAPASPGTPANLTEDEAVAQEAWALPSRSSRRASTGSSCSTRSPIR